MVVEEQERPLQRWDYFHCRLGPRHVIVGAGHSPCVVLMIGARREPETFGYPLSEIAAKYGASVARRLATPTRRTPVGRTTSSRRASRGRPHDEPHGGILSWIQLAASAEIAWVVTPDEIRALAQTLPRSCEVFVQGRIKFRVGQIVWLALSEDGARMGCGFPREVRQAAVEAEPHKFQLPSEGDMRFNWIHVRLDAIDAGEMRDLVEEAWSRTVPLYVARAYGRKRGYLAER